ncbi:MAG: DNA polymerase III subunit delta' [Candidatus Thiodiazotropha sp.]
MIEGPYHPLPWHQALWHRLRQASLVQRLPHALLLCGAAGLGKAHFARAFAQSCLCEQPDETGLACGKCRHCHLVMSKHHPDFQWISPDAESKSGEIKIETIRDFTDKAALTTHSAQYKLIAIEPAHRMSHAAANSLLKTLEEPTPGTIILLLTDQPARLLPTIRSRCQTLSFYPPERDAALSWLGGQIRHGAPELLLALANGAPLKSLELDNPELLVLREEMLNGFLALGEGRLDPVKLAGQWGNLTPVLTLEWLIGWVIDLVYLKNGTSSARLFNPDRAQALQKTADKLNSRALQGYLQSLYQASGLIDRNINLQLALERLLIEWHACSQAGR